MIEITNDGPLIASTNFWDGKYASAGYVFLSWNAGVGRLLIPDSALSMIPETRGAREVIVSVGPWSACGDGQGIEILFEDDSDSPFVIHICSQQTDRLLPDTDQGGGFEIHVWTRMGRELAIPGRFRRVDSLPCLRPWEEH